MEDSTLLSIAKRINEVAGSDGVHARVDLNPVQIIHKPEICKVWDIELMYNNFHYVERFNSGMPVDEFECDRIVGILLKGLFSDYFDSKLSV